MAVGIEIEKQNEKLPTFPRISASSLRILEMENPELVTRPEMEGSIRGYIGHSIDNHLIATIRSARESGSISSVKDSAEETRVWFADWKSRHTFISQEGRKSTNRFLEGEVFSAEEVEVYWRSRKVADFSDSLFTAYEKQIDELVYAEENNYKLPFPMLAETDPNTELYVEQSFAYNTQIGYQSAQIAVRRDYLMYEPNEDLITITDVKFGSDFEPKMEDVVLYTMFARSDVDALRKHGNFLSQRPSVRNHVKLNNVMFYYRHFDQRRSQFVYLTTNVAELHSDENLELLEKKVSDYKNNYAEIKRLKKIRSKSFVMPQPSEEPIERGDDFVHQPRLIYLSND